MHVLGKHSLITLLSLHACSRQTQFDTTSRLRATIRHCRKTDSDVTIGQCTSSDRNLACAILIRLKILADSGDKVYLLP